MSNTTTTPLATPIVMVPSLRGAPPLSEFHQLRDDLSFDDHWECVKLDHELRDLYDKINLDNAFPLSGLAVGAHDITRHILATFSRDLRMQYNHLHAEYRDKCEGHHEIRLHGVPANDNVEMTDQNFVAVDLAAAAMSTTAAQGATAGTSMGKPFSISFQMGPLPSNTLVFRGAAAVIVVGAMIAAAAALAPVGI